MLEGIKEERKPYYINLGSLMQPLLRWENFFKTPSLVPRLKIFFELFERRIEKVAIILQRNDPKSRNRAKIKLPQVFDNIWQHLLIAWGEQNIHSEINVLSVYLMDHFYTGKLHKMGLYYIYRCINSTCSTQTALQKGIWCFSACSSCFFINRNEVSPVAHSA